MDSYSEIKKIFEGEADKENAEAMSKYMRNKFEFYAGEETGGNRLVFSG